jgi:hypothetical protein
VITNWIPPDFSAEPHKREFAILVERQLGGDDQRARVKIISNVRAACREPNPWIGIRVYLLSRSAQVRRVLGSGSDPALEVGNL